MSRNANKSARPVRTSKVNKSAPSVQTSEPRRVTIRPNTWMSIDDWIAAYEAVRDPDGKYVSVGLRGGFLFEMDGAS